IPTEVPMRLIGLAVVLALSLILASLAGEAQQAGRVYRVGVPWIPPQAGVLPLIRALEDGLRERGYEVGQNLVSRIASRMASPSGYHNNADLVRLNVIVVGLNPVAIAARQATQTIPIVMAIATDPINAGLVKSLLTRYDEKGWRATFYTTGMEHSPTSATGTAWEATPWRAVQHAARDAL